MTKANQSAETRSQADKFKEAAKEHDADPSVRRWNERIKKVAQHKPSKPE